MCFLFHVLLVFPLKQTIALCCALFCIFEEEKNLLAITYFISLPTQTPSPPPQTLLYATIPESRPLPGGPAMLGGGHSETEKQLVYESGGRKMTLKSFIFLIICRMDTP